MAQATSPLGQEIPVPGPLDLSTVKMREVMTPLPLTIDEDTDLATARRLMREKKIRHLPVMHAGRLTGLLSDRDTRLVTLLPDISKVAVADVMSTRPLTVPEDMVVTDAVARMAEKKYGSVVVTGPGDRIAGIFTSQDALRLLMHERAKQLPAPTGWPLRECDDYDEDVTEEDDCLG